MELTHVKDLSIHEEPFDLSKYEFLHYARQNYRAGSPFQHRRGPLEKPLHFQVNEQNYEASLTMYVVIQRLMFDLPEPCEGEASEEDTVFLRTLERNNKGFRGGTFKRKIESVKTPGWTSIPPLSSMSKPTTNMEKVRFICSYGIYCKELRDEIYNQICIQLTNNPSKTSTSRGWILMALCLGCFLPSDVFINYLWTFVKNGPEGYTDYCMKRLKRTRDIGGRKLAPASLELQAAKMEGKIILPVTTMDGLVYEFEVDSSTTCKELIDGLQEKVGLKSTFGFSVYAKQFDQVFSWGCGNDCIMDLVSLCEQYAIYKNVPEKDRDNWSIFVRKDVFLPTYNAANDPVETDLVYSQIIGGVHVGEYQFMDINELADLLARRYYIDNGKTMDDEKLGKLIESSGPHDIDHQQHITLAQLIRQNFQKLPSIVNMARPMVLKLDIVEIAASKKSWAKNFSRIFKAYYVSGTKFPKGDVRLFFNSFGIDVLSTSKKGKETVFLSVEYQHIASITNDSAQYIKGDRADHDVNHYLTIHTYDQSNYIFTSDGAEEMYNLGNTLLEDYKKGDPDLALLNGSR